MDILISGGNGFLGSSLANNLLNNFNHKIYLLLRESSDIFRLSENIDKFQVYRYKYDIDIINFVTEVNPDLILHTACSYGRNGESLLEIFDANFRFGLIILKSAIKLNKEVIFLNSATSLPPNLNIYSLSKFYFLEYAKSVSQVYKEKLKFVNIELQYIYGPNDDKSKFIPYMIDACCSNIKNIQLTKGEQLRDYIYIDDVVNAYSFIINNLESFNKFDKIELGSGNVISIRNLALKIHGFTNSSTILDFGKLPYRTNEIMFSKANLEFLNSLGWYPKYDIVTGIEKTINIY